MTYRKKELVDAILFDNTDPLGRVWIYMQQLFITGSVSTIIDGYPTDELLLKDTAQHGQDITRESPTEEK